jgi:hypothetical protein
MSLELGHEQRYWARSENTGPGAEGLGKEKVDWAMNRGLCHTQEDCARRRRTKPGTCGYED